MAVASDGSGGSKRSGGGDRGSGGSNWGIEAGGSTASLAFASRLLPRPVPPRRRRRQRRRHPPAPAPACRGSRPGAPGAQSLAVASPRPPCLTPPPPLAAAVVAAMGAPATPASGGGNGGALPPAREGQPLAAASSGGSYSSTTAATAVAMSEHAAAAAAGALTPRTPPTPPTRILLLMSDTGGGHRASAAALTAALTRHAGATAVSATTVDLFVDVAGWPLSGLPAQYSFLARHPLLWRVTWALGIFPPTRLLCNAVLRTLAGRALGRRLVAEAAASAGGGDVASDAAASTGPPDVIVSVHPLAQSAAVTALRMLAEAEAAAVGGGGGGTATTSPVPGLLRPLLTVVTDLGAAHPLWFTPAATRVYSPSAAVSGVAVGEGVPPARLRRYGLPVRPTFWELNGGDADAKPDPIDGGGTAGEGGAKPDAAAAAAGDSPPTGDAAGSKAALRARLGLHPTAPAVLLVGGGDGVGGLRRVVPAVVDGLAATLGATGAQVVVVCGRNERLRSSFARRTWALVPAAVDSGVSPPRGAAEGQQEGVHGSPDAAAVAVVDSGSGAAGGSGGAAGGVIVLGFVSNMADYMRAADMLITKAGPGTIAEALICRLPILLCAYLPGQETGNVTYVVDHGVGAYESAPARIAATAAEWAASPSLRAAMAARAGALAAPDAAVRIAEDIWAVAVASRAARAGAAVVGGGAAAATATRGRRRRLGVGEPGGASVLFDRVKALLRLLCGGAIAWSAASGGGGGRGERAATNGDFV